MHWFGLIMILVCPWYVCFCFVSIIIDHVSVYPSCHGCAFYVADIWTVDHRGKVLLLKSKWIVGRTLNQFSVFVVFLVLPFIFWVVQVISRVCRQMQISSLEAGGIHPGMTPALKDLHYKIREVNMFIEVCVHVFAAFFKLHIWLTIVEIQTVFVLFLSVCWVGVIHLYSVWAGPFTCRLEGQEALWGTKPGAALQTPPHPPHIQDWQ